MQNKGSVLKVAKATHLKTQTSTLNRNARTIYLLLSKNGPHQKKTDTTSVLKVEKRPYEQNNPKSVGVTVLTFDKMDFKPKLVRKDKGNHTLIKGMVTEYRYAVTLSNL